MLISTRTFAQESQAEYLSRVYNSRLLDFALIGFFSAPRCIGLSKVIRLPPMYILN